MGVWVISASAHRRHTAPTLTGLTLTALQCISRRYVTVTHALITYTGIRRSQMQVVCELCVSNQSINQFLFQAKPIKQQQRE